ncbi:MAG: enoyl-CoA hydratase-related protein [Thermodesulfobacteriota bacterium]|nr:enoyl-CoA hydratase-related protein [Thermodesulfobacteriota bacterium]
MRRSWSFPGRSFPSQSLGTRGTRPLPRLWGAWLYPKALGPAKAMEMLYTGDALSAAEAKEIGMLNHVASRESLEGVTMAMVTKILNGPPIAIRLMK